MKKSIRRTCVALCASLLVAAGGLTAYAMSGSYYWRAMLPSFRNGVDLQDGYMKGDTTGTVEVADMSDNDSMWFLVRAQNGDWWTDVTSTFYVPKGAGAFDYFLNRVVGYNTRLMLVGGNNQVNFSEIEAYGYVQFP